jgi:hypothetical protein
VIVVDRDNIMCYLLFALTMAGKNKCSDKSGLHSDIREMVQVINDFVNKHTQYMDNLFSNEKIFKLNLLIMSSIWMHILIEK